MKSHLVWFFLVFAACASVPFGMVGEVKLQGCLCCQQGIEGIRNSNSQVMHFYVYLESGGIRKL